MPDPLRSLAFMLPVLHRACLRHHSLEYPMHRSSQDSSAGRLTQKDSALVSLQKYRTSKQQHGKHLSLYTYIYRYMCIYACMCLSPIYMFPMCLSYIYLLISHLARLSSAGWQSRDRTTNAANLMVAIYIPSTTSSRPLPLAV